MVGRVGAEAIGAVSLASILFITVGAFGGGVMLGLDTLVPAGIRNRRRPGLSSFAL